MIQKLQKQQRTLLWVCLIFVSFVYFISSAYITNSNDGSHFALTSAIVEKGTVEIAGYEEYVEGMDYALQGNRILSDRIPGTAFLAIPFFSIGHVFSFVHDNLSEIMVLFLPQLAGVLLVYLIFRLSFYFSKNFNVSLLSALLFAFTTLVWFESTHLFSHILSAVTAFGAAYLCVKLKKGDTGKIILVAALLGLSSIIEIQNILLVPAFLLYLFSRKKIDIKFWKDKGVMMGTLVFVAVYAILIGYNYVAFSEFTIKSNKYNPNFIEEQAFSSSLSGNPIKGLDHLFTNFSEMHFVTTWADGVRHNSPGYFILSPLLLISLVGFYFFSKQYSRETELFVYIILVISLIGAFHKTVITRHVFTMLPFLWFPIIFVLDKISHLDKRTRSVLLTGISIVAVYSIARVFYVMNSYWNRSFSDPFPFVRELCVYVIFYLILVSLFFGCRGVWQRLKTK